MSVGINLPYVAVNPGPRMTDRLLDIAEGMASLYATVKTADVQAELAELQLRNQVAAEQARQREITFGTTSQTPGAGQSATGGAQAAADSVSKALLIGGAIAVGAVAFAVLR